MNRVRSSSVESKYKYQTYQSKYNQNRIQSLICSRHELYSDLLPLDSHCDGEWKKDPLVSNNELKNQIDLLQYTIDKMLNYGAFGECSSEIISETLQLEYYQMISALKKLENILSLKRKSIDKISFSDYYSDNNSQVRQLQAEISHRDSMIKCLSDRIEILYKANDQLVVDYENQETVLSEELFCLQAQLEKAKNAMRTLKIFKKRRKKSCSQELESEIFYLRESLSTKELIIADLEERIGKLNQNDLDLCDDLAKVIVGEESGGLSQQSEEACYEFKERDDQDLGLEDLNNDQTRGDVVASRGISHTHEGASMQCELNVILRKRVDKCGLLDDSREQVTEGNEDERRVGRSTEFIDEKDKEIKESEIRVELSEKDIREMEIERIGWSEDADDCKRLINVANCYEPHDGLRDEEIPLGNEKEEQSRQFDKDLRCSKEKCITNQIAIDSFQENMSHPLIVTSKSIETQTMFEDKDTLLHSRTESEQPNKVDHYRESETVVQKIMHSKKYEDIGDGVLGLQQAIDKYNSLLADVVLHGDVGASSSTRDRESSKITERSLPCSHDLSVTLDEVKLAVAGEMSIKNLRRFAILLAEDDFELAAEIKKLLTTVEDLRQQLTDNCELLVESVDMLENCEQFVADVETRLSQETSKLENVCSRYGPCKEVEAGQWHLVMVDERNGFCAQLVTELQGLMGGSSLATDPGVQRRCDHLLRCIRADKEGLRRPT